jgi:hypothetical protein
MVCGSDITGVALVNPTEALLLVVVVPTMAVLA